MKIKKGLVWFQLLVMGLTIHALAQEEKQKEYVQVVNVEMILRVLKDGAPVAGSEEKRFLAFEDGVQCEINGFFENHRRIARRRIARQTAAATQAVPAVFLGQQSGVRCRGRSEQVFLQHIPRGRPGDPEHSPKNIRPAVATGNHERHNALFWNNGGRKRRTRSRPGFNSMEI